MRSVQQRRQLRRMRSELLRRHAGLFRNGWHVLLRFRVRCIHAHLLPGVALVRRYNERQQQLQRLRKRMPGQRSELRGRRLQLPFTEGSVRGDVHRHDFGSE
jgi:hypothetical protein